MNQNYNCSRLLYPCIPSQTGGMQMKTSAFASRRAQTGSLHSSPTLTPERARRLILCDRAALTVQLKFPACWLEKPSSVWLFQQGPSHPDTNGIAQCSQSPHRSFSKNPERPVKRPPSPSSNLPQNRHIKRERLTAIIERGGRGTILPHPPYVVPLGLIVALAGRRFLYNSFLSC